MVSPLLVGPYPWPKYNLKPSLRADDAVSIRRQLGAVKDSSRSKSPDMACMHCKLKAINHYRASTAAAASSAWHTIKSNHSHSSTQHSTEATHHICTLMLFYFMLSGVLCLCFGFCFVCACRSRWSPCMGHEALPGHTCKSSFLPSFKQPHLHRTDTVSALPKAPLSMLKTFCSSCSVDVSVKFDVAVRCLLLHST